MKSMVIALATCGFTLVSCQKDGGGSGGLSVEIPNAGLVGPEGFKNTAKNASEVSAHLRQSADATGQVSFGGQTPNQPGPRPTPLTSPAVDAFLAGDSDAPGMPSFSLPRDGGDCGSSLNGLNSVVAVASSSLRSTADALVEFDAGELPDGVTKEPPSEQYAVSYAVDLSKLETATSSSASSADGSSSYTPNGSMSSAPSGDMKVSGLARFGAGANDDLAILGLGYNVTMASQGNSANGSGGFSVGAYSKQQKLMMHVSTDINAVLTDGRGQAHNGRLAATSTATLIAGEHPSIELAVTGSGNGFITGVDGSGPGMGADESAAPSTPSVVFDAKNHSLSANVKIAKVSNNEVSFTMALNADGKEQRSNLVLTSDGSGNCVVKQAGQTRALTRN